MRDSEAKRRTLAQAEKVLKDFFNEHPLTTVAAVFGAGVALATSGNSERGLAAAKHIGRRMAENHGMGLFERVSQGTLGQVLLRTSMASMYDLLGQFLPRRNQPLHLNPNKSNHYN